VIHKKGRQKKEPNTEKNNGSAERQESRLGKKGVKKKIGGGLLFFFCDTYKNNSLPWATTEDLSKKKEEGRE